MNMTSLGGLCLPVKSKAPSVDEGPLQYIDLSAIDARSKTINEPKQIDADDAPSRARQRVSATDVLVSTVRPNLNGVAQVPVELDGAVASTGFTVLRANPELLDHRYLFHWVCGEQFISEMVRQVTGASYPAVSDRIIKASRIPFPPLPEQRRIASILDEAQNRRVKSRDLKSRLADMEFSVYQSFARAGSGSVRLGDLASFVRGVTFKPESVIDPGEEGALRFMRTTNVKDQLDTSDVKAIAPSVKVREEQMLRDGDILVSTANSWNLVGRASYVAELPWPSTFGGFVSVLRPNGASVSPRFLYSWFTSPRVQATLRSFGQQTTNISNLNTARALELRVPVLNAEDRERFEKVIFKVDGLRIPVWRQESLADELVSTLRARAFRGEL